MSRAAHRTLTPSGVTVRRTTASVAAIALSIAGAASAAPLAGAAEAVPAEAPSAVASGGASSTIAPAVTRFSMTSSSFTAGRTPTRVRVGLAGAAGTTGRAVVRVLGAAGRRTLFTQDLGAVTAGTTTVLKLQRTAAWRPGRYRLRLDVRGADGTAFRRRGAPTWRRVTVRAARSSAGATPAPAPAAGASAAAPSAGGYVFPVQGACNFSSAGQAFGAPRGGGRRHLGQDLGTFTSYPPAVAITAATVSAAFYDDSGGGWTLIMDGGDGYSWGYLHLKAGSILVGVGQRVAAGQRVATVGDSGGDFEPNLHVEQRPRPWAANRDRAIDPRPLLARLPGTCAG